MPKPATVFVTRNLPATHVFTHVLASTCACTHICTCGWTAHVYALCVCTHVYRQGKSPVGSLAMRRMQWFCESATNMSSVKISTPPSTDMLLMSLIPPPPLALLKKIHKKVAIKAHPRPNTNDSAIPAEKCWHRRRHVCRMDMGVLAQIMKVSARMSSRRVGLGDTTLWQPGGNDPAGPRHTPGRMRTPTRPQTILLP